eukprot:1733121-Pyramimonas_sp.AAC.1
MARSPQRTLCESHLISERTRLAPRRLGRGAPIRRRRRGNILMALQSDAGSVGIFSWRTNQKAGPRSILSLFASLALLQISSARRRLDGARGSTRRFQSAWTHRAADIPPPRFEGRPAP